MRLFSVVILMICTLTAWAETATKAKKVVVPLSDQGDYKMCDDNLECLGRNMKIQDLELNRVYKLALAALPESDPTDNRKGRPQLIKSQRTWLEYRNENCDFIGGQEGGSNSWVTLYSVLCILEDTDSRINFLKRIVEHDHH